MKLTGTDDIRWSKNLYNTRTFIKSEKFPVFVLVTKGYYGVDECETLANDQVVRMHSRISQKRVLARDGRGRTLSIPDSYQVQFRVVKKRSKKKGKVKLGKPKSLRELLVRYRLPLEVHFDHKTPVQFKIGTQNYTTRDFGPILLQRSYFENFFRGNAIHNGIIDSKVLLIPSYLDIDMRVAEGLKDGNEDQWKSFQDMQERAVSNVNFDAVYGNKEIMLYPDDALDMARSEAWAAASISDVSHSPSDLGSRPSQRMKANETMVLCFETNDPLNHGYSSAPEGRPIKVSQPHGGLIPPGHMSSTSGVMSSSDHASRRYVYTNGHHRARRGSYSSTSSADTEISTVSERPYSKGSQPNIVRIRMKDKNRKVKNYQDTIMSRHSHDNYGTMSYEPPSRRKYRSYDDVRNDFYVRGTGTNTFSDINGNGYTGSFIVAKNRKPRGRSRTKRSLEKHRSPRSYGDDSVFYSLDRSMNYANRIPPPPYNTGTTYARRASSTGDVRIVPVSAKYVRSSDSHTETMGGRRFRSQEAIYTPGGVLTLPSTSARVNTDVLSQTGTHVDPAVSEPGSPSARVKRIMSPNGTLYVTTDTGYRKAYGKFRQADANGTYNPLGVPVSDFGIYNTEYQRFGADFGTKADSLRKVPMVRAGNGDIMYKGTVNVSNYQNQSLPRRPLPEERQAHERVEGDTAGAPVREQPDPSLTSIQHTFETVSDIAEASSTTNRGYSTLPNVKSTNYVYRLNLDGSPAFPSSTLPFPKRNTTIISHDLPAPEQVPASRVAVSQETVESHQYHQQYQSAGPSVQTDTSRSVSQQYMTQTQTNSAFHKVENSRTAQLPSFGTVPHVDILQQQQLQQGHDSVPRTQSQRRQSPVINIITPRHPDTQVRQVAGTQNAWAENGGSKTDMMKQEVNQTKGPPHQEMTQVTSTQQMDVQSNGQVNGSYSPSGQVTNQERVETTIETKTSHTSQTLQNEINDIYPMSGNSFLENGAEKDAPTPDSTSGPMMNGHPGDVYPKEGPAVFVVPPPPPEPPVIHQATSPTHPATNDIKSTDNTEKKPSKGKHRKGDKIRRGKQSRLVQREVKRLEKHGDVNSLRDMYKIKKQRSPLPDASGAESDHSVRIDTLDDLTNYLRTQADVDTQSEHSMRSTNEEPRLRATESWDT